MKRWLTHAIIGLYLGALGFGVMAHAVNYKVGSHPAMYFVVWDMFCGWSSHATRYQVFALGEDDRYYELAPGPWGEIKPYGKLGRRHYDSFCIFTQKMAFNCLNHTDHVPIRRIYIVEETWPKKYNLPDRVYARRHPDAKDPHHYYHLRYELDADGNVIQQFGEWHNYQAALCVSNNPRLIADARKGRPFYNIAMPQSRISNTGMQEWNDTAGRAPAATRLGGGLTN